MAPHLPRGAAWRPGARAASFLVFVVVLLAATIAATLGPSSPARSAPSTAPRPTNAPRPSRSLGGPSQQVTPTAPSPTGASPGPRPSTVPPRHDALARLAAYGRPIYCGAGRKPLVALTFDDGPGTLTPKALRLLRRFHAKASFFLVGKLLADPAFAAIAREEARMGMALGDHTWDHVNMTDRSTSFDEREIGQTADAARRTTGQRPRLFRPPYGAHDPRLDRWVRDQGMLEILWSTDSGDSQGLTTARVYRTVRRGIRPGAIILLHDNRGTTETALTEILRRIERRGLKPVTVPYLLTRDPPTRQQLLHHTCT